MKIDKMFTMATAASVACFLNVCAAQADLSACKASIKHVKGSAHYSVNQGNWVPLKTNILLETGTLIKTAPESTVTLIFQDSGHVLTANPNTVLRLVKLASGKTGLESVSETSLDLIQGSVVSSQRKTSSLSQFTVNGVSVPSGSNNKIDSKGEISSAPTQEPLLVFAQTDAGSLGRGPEEKPQSPHGNNGVGNGEDPAPPGNDGGNDGTGTGPGNPGNGRPNRP